MLGSGPLPHSEEAEISVLGAPFAALDDGGETTARLLEMVCEEDFFLARHRAMYCAIRRVRDRGEPVDVVTVSEALKEAGELEAAGGMAYLAQLVDAVPTAANLEVHAARLREYRARREIAKAAEEALEAAHGRNGPKPPAEIVTSLRTRLDGSIEPSRHDRVWDYAELCENPELTEPPKAVVPRIAFREHLTLVSSDAKGGKTTLAAAGAAAVANGDRFLGQSTGHGHVLWIKAEGHRGMVVQYLQRFGAKPVPDRITIVESGAEPVAELEKWTRSLEPDLVVVDTWTSWTATLGLDYWKEADVAPVLKRLEAVARSGPAVLLLHHNRRADQQPRGSGHLMAVADLLRIVEDGSHERERKVTGRGRFPCEPFRYALVEADDRMYVQLVDPDREIEERIFDFLETNPGVSKRAIRQAVDGDNRSLDRALQTLVEDGIVERDTSGPAHTHRIRQNPRQHATSTVQHGQQHGGADSEGEHRAGEGGEIRSISPSQHGPPDSAVSQP